MTTPTIQQIDPQQIDPDPTQPRQEIDSEAQQALEESIAAQGVLQPLKVVDLGDGRYQVLYGERRWRAALATNQATVPCIVVDGPTWDEALDIQLTENLLRSDLRPLELAQSLYRRMLLANIIALEEEQGRDHEETDTLLEQYLTPAGQIVVLADRLCALANVASVDAYFGSGRVRVPRKSLLARYGMSRWSEDRLKRLFQTLDVDPSVQDALAGIDVSARTLRALSKRDPADQVALVKEAKATGDHVGKTLQQQLAQQQTIPDEPAEEEALDGALLASDAAPTTFVSDPSLALLTSSRGSAERLVTDRPPPERGHTPPPGHDQWESNQVLQLEAALEAVITVCQDAGAATLDAGQIRRIQVIWSQVQEAINRIGLEAL